MTFVGDDEVEGVDWNFQLLGVVVDCVWIVGEDRLTAKQINCHALNRGDVDEGKPRLRAFQIMLRE